VRERIAVNVPTVLYFGLHFATGSFA